MAQAQEMFLAIRSCRAPLRRGGSGPPLLFLHGAGGLPGWMPFLAKLADRFDVLAPDHPSFGRSETPDWLEDVADLGLLLSRRSPGTEARQCPCRRPLYGRLDRTRNGCAFDARMKSLTLISSAGIRLKGRPAADIFVMDRNDLIRARYADAALAESEIDAVLTPEQETQMLGKSHRGGAALLAAAPVKTKARPMAASGRRADARHLGDADKIIDPAYAQAFGELIAGARVTMIANTGHLPHVERVDAVVALD